MSTASDPSTAISNSAQRQITVILFGTNRNLTRAELKKTFAVKKGMLGKASKFAIEADVFDDLFAVRASRPEEGLFFNYESKNSVSHIYVVDQGTCTKEFAILKYGTELLGGFDTCTTELKELYKLLQAYGAITLLLLKGQNSLHSLHHQLKKIVDSELTNSCQFKELFSKSVQELSENTHPIISLEKDKVDEWFEMHFWKDDYSSSEAVSDKAI
jgi:hypothetical protein